MNLPNKLTMLRVLIIPAAAALLLAGTDAAARSWALVLYCLATATDFADGYIARKMHLTTNFGKFMDPLADKLLVLSILICLTAKGEVPAWPVILIMAREIAISGFRLIAAERGLVIAAGILGKIKTTLQNIWIIALLSPVSGAWVSVLRVVLMWSAAVMTVVSFADYVCRNRNVLKEN